MSELETERERLAGLVVRFTDAFNRDDLDGVMSFLADDAVYDEFNGTVNRGRAAIRAAFVPQFRGDYGTLRFHAEDLFVDPVAGKALIRWVCTFQTKRGPAGWRGLDILHVRNGLITEKLTYAKAKVPLLSAAQNA
ncbi:MAG: nuclear transport factor 2 family protein [Candidatus Rokubacteria bacterium]|nr:nuclear transport factor 2 family protein [Candidatus Rokubacteria bacterium]